MNQIPTSIPKQMALAPAEDFYFLRKEGIGFIEQMASSLWTDYNTHDPGITILESICFAFTDLAYRLGWDMEDILAPETASSDPAQPYPGQAFFTARNILTVNPVTQNDLRRLLIDLPEIRNAWVLCKKCACDLSYYAWCDNDKLMLSYKAPNDTVPAPRQVSPRGLYETLLELEVHPKWGDLNARKLEHTAIFHDGDGPHQLLMELRFPDFALADIESWGLFLVSESFSTKVKRLGATKTFDVFSLPDENEQNRYIRNNWNNVLYMDLEVLLAPSNKSINIENATLRLFSDAATKNATTASSLKAILENKDTNDFVQRYHNVAAAADAAISSAVDALLAHRNLGEDYCSIRVVGIEEVAACADVEVAPDANIEDIQGRVWFEIEQYFSSPVRFHTLQELMDAGNRVEDIFNGPELVSGFISDEDIEASSLNTALRTSDIINRLMKIEGVISVNRLTLTKYDSEGNVVASAPWLLYIANQHLPRLYTNASRFLFYKGGLPFVPRMDEACDTLNQLRGTFARPKNSGVPEDLLIPNGTFRNPEDYFPVQYGLPPTYGTSPVGLPSQASVLRQAQAKQLKAYLMLFEQMLGNVLAQLAHCADLFSLDAKVERTYFVKEFSEALLCGFNDIFNTKPNEPEKSEVERITESPPEFYARRNRFLDHLLARFGEQFSEYALLLSKVDGKQIALKRLILDKISFLKAYPLISHDRARAFNYSRPHPFDYSQPEGINDNQPGIKKRISLLLGYPDLKFTWHAADLGGGNFQVDFQLGDSAGSLWLEGGLPIGAGTADQAKEIARRTILEQMIHLDAYEMADENGGYRLKLKNNSAVLGQSPNLFSTKAEAASMLDELLAWSANDRLIVVEHLLLRPKFPGDALYPACVDGGCCTCGDEDPYSFRLTYVMPGWSGMYNDNLDMRRFAERTIQQETPSHLLGKTCWVGNDGVNENPCDEIVGDLAGLLIDKGVAGGDAEACVCANAIYHAFSLIFQNWYADKALDYIRPDALIKQVAALFANTPKASDINCGTHSLEPLWGDVQSLMSKYFQQIALHGLQFEKFEEAWHTWLDANRTFKWTEERLHERVEAMLRRNLAGNSGNDEAVCQCATNILTQYGMEFFKWMNDNLGAGLALENFSQFNPAPIGLCAGLDFLPGTSAAIEKLLGERYGTYKEVSYRLHIVVNQLSALRNTYPGATLHDCAMGGDENPVRLNNTALGNYRVKTPTS